MDGFDELQKNINTSEEALWQIVLSIFSSYINFSFQATGIWQVLFVASFLFLYIQILYYFSFSNSSAHCIFDHMLQVLPFLPLDLIILWI